MNARPKKRYLKLLHLQVSFPLFLDLAVVFYFGLFLCNKWYGCTFTVHLMTNGGYGECAGTELGPILHQTFSFYEFWSAIERQISKIHKSYMVDEGSQLGEYWWVRKPPSSFEDVRREELMEYSPQKRSRSLLPIHFLDPKGLGGEACCEREDVCSRP